MKTFALIPAAGQSRRMGRCKLSLMIDGQTVLSRVLEAVRGAGIAETFVVLGPTSASLAPEVTRQGGTLLLLAAPTLDMRATIQSGLTSIEERSRPCGDDAILLLPADHPTMKSDVIRALLTRRSQCLDNDAFGRGDIFVPTHAGKRGHPVLFAWSHVKAIRALPIGQGLNVYFRKQARATVEIDWANADVLCDLDTPEDLARLSVTRA